MSAVLAAVALTVAGTIGLERGAGRALGRWHRALARSRLGADPRADGRFPQVDRLVGATSHRVRRSRRARAADGALPDWIEAAARSVRAGCSLAEALAQASVAVHDTALAPAAGAVATGLGDGEPLIGCLERFVADSPTPTRRLVTDALVLAWETGGPPARLLDSVGATLRERLAVQAEARALATQSRLSAWVLALAPVAFALLTAGVDPRVLAYFGSPPGVACLMAGGALEAVGAWWMARLVGAAS